jgi:hypothetical protein
VAYYQGEFDENVLETCKLPRPLYHTAIFLRVIALLVVQRAYLPHY